MLACARLGVINSQIFGGFSGNRLWHADRRLRQPGAHHHGRLLPDRLDVRPQGQDGRGSRRSQPAGPGRRPGGRVAAPGGRVPVQHADGRRPRLLSLAAGTRPWCCGRRSACCRPAAAERAGMFRRSRSRGRDGGPVLARPVHHPGRARNRAARVPGLDRGPYRQRAGANLAGVAIPTRSLANFDGEGVTDPTFIKLAVRRAGPRRGGREFACGWPLWLRLVRAMLAWPAAVDVDALWCGRARKLA